MTGFPCISQGGIKLYSFRDIALAQVCLLLVLGSWMLGGRASWALEIIGILGWSCLIPLVIAARRGNRGVFFRGLLWFLPWIALIAIGVVSILNPAYETVDPITGYVLKKRDFIEFLPTCIDQRRTVSFLLLLSGLMIVSVASFAFLREGKYARRLLMVTFANSVLLACVGLLFHFLDSEKILGIFEPVNEHYFSVFLYRNHWIAYCILSIGIGLLLFEKALLKKQTRMHLTGIGFGVFVLVLTIPLSGSRFGLLFLLFLLIVAGVRMVMIRSGNLRRLVFIVGVGVMILCGSVFFTASGVVKKRWETTERQISEFADGNRSELRIYAYRDTISMIKERPVWGWGLGSYLYVFPMFAGEEFLAFGGGIAPKMEFAHQDYLQCIAELGIVGFLFLVLVPLRFVFTASSESYRFPGVWLGGGCWVILFYALFEFPLSNPAVLSLFVVLLSVGVGAYHADSKFSDKGYT